MYRYSLTPSIAADIEALDILRTQSCCAHKTPGRFSGRLKRELEAAAVAGSVSIEGVPATSQDVLRVLIGDVPPGLRLEECAAIDAYREAFAWAIEHACEPSFAWRERYVLGVHQRLMACAADTEDPGGYRTMQVFLGSPDDGGFSYQPPQWHLVRDLVIELCEWANESDDHPALRAALAHVRLAGIHPFHDGNGRVARILASVMMITGGFLGPEFTSLEQWWGARRREYYRAFHALGIAWHPDADVTGFVEAHVGAQRAYAETSHRASRIECTVYSAIEAFLAENPGFEPRSVEALHDATFGRTVSSQLYRALTGVSTAEAMRDLGRLEGAGLLYSCEVSGERRFTGTGELLTSIARYAGMDAREERVPSLAEYRQRLIARIAEGIAERCQP